MTTSNKIITGIAGVGLALAGVFSVMQTDASTEYSKVGDDKVKITTTETQEVTVELKDLIATKVALEADIANIQSQKEKDMGGFDRMLAERNEQLDVINKHITETEKIGVKVPVEPVTEPNP